MVHIIWKRRMNYAAIERQWKQRIKSYSRILKILQRGKQMRIINLSLKNGLNDHHEFSLSFGNHKSKGELLDKMT